MTVICFDRSVLATDSAYIYADGTLAASTSKIIVFDQMAFAQAGSQDDGNLFLDWLYQGRPLDDYPKLEGDFEGVVIYLDDNTGASVYRYVAKHPEGSQIVGRMSFGNEAAAHYANAVMDMGHDAVEAARMAANYQVSCCREPIFSISLKELAKTPKGQYALWTGPKTSKFVQIKPKLSQSQAKGKRAKPKSSTPSSKSTIIFTPLHSVMK